MSTPDEDGPAPATTTGDVEPSGGERVAAPEAKSDGARPKRRGPVAWWLAWVARLDKREETHSLALARVLAGLTVAGHLLRMRQLGVDRAVWCDVAHGGVHMPYAHPFITRFGGLTYENITIWLYATVVCSLFMTVGLFSRVATVATWLLWDRLVRTSGMHYNGADALVTNITFLLMFAASNRSLSLDALIARKRGKPLEALAPAWPRYLLIIQLSITYVTTGLQKVSSGWIPGGPADALWYILQQPTWQRRDHRWLAPAYPITQVATLASWLFEVGGFILLVHFWYRATASRPGRVRGWFNRHDVRKWYLLFGLAMHAGIDALMEIGPFMTAMTAMYAACLHPSETKAMLARLGTPFRRDSAKREATAGPTPG